MVDPRLRVMPSGVLGSSEGRSGWAEDLCVYRRGQLLFGTVSHEAYAFLHVSDAEWREWRRIAGRSGTT